jgi:hypothetical protein
MDKANIIQFNDELRTGFRGGCIEVDHGPYDLEDRIIGRMLCVFARYNRFEPRQPAQRTSLHLRRLRVLLADSSREQ